MKKIVIGFSKAKSAWAIGSEIIAASEKRKYSHVYIMVRDTETMIPMVYQASNGYVNCRPLVAFLSSHDVVAQYLLELDDAVYVQIMRFLKSNLGVPYSYAQILAIAIKKILHIQLNVRNQSAAYICSELGALVCQLSGISFGKNIDFITPSDLERVLKLNGVPRYIGVSL
jgi:hypothetical protein